MAAETPAAAKPANASTTAGVNSSLSAVLEIVEESLERLDRDVRDYTCRIVRRERHKGKLGPYGFINVKIRRGSIDPGGGPFSVYLKFTSPPSLAGREVLYIEGRNDDKLLVRRGGQRLAYITTYLDPESPMAMQGNRHPVTDIGFYNLLRKIFQDVREDRKEANVEVRFYENAKIGDRPCTRIAIIHPQQLPGFDYYRTDLFFDKQWRLPAAVATYTWPEKPGGRPPLVEQYIYDQLKINVGLTDADFSRANPEYGFLKKSASSNP